MDGDIEDESDVQWALIDKKYGFPYGDARKSHPTVIDIYLHPFTLIYTYLPLLNTLKCPQRNHSPYYLYPVYYADDEV